MRAFITGVDGFAASHLVDHLLRDPINVVGGTVLPGVPLQNTAHAAESIRTYPADLLDPDALARSLADFAPNIVFHLAAVSFVPSAPDAVHRVNVDGSKNLLAAMKNCAAGARGVLVSSSEVYGIQPPEAGPIDEDRPARPANPYAASKLAMEAEAARFAEQGLDLVVLRPFNHFGPRQSPDFVVSSFCRQIAEIEAGLREPLLRVGNLSPKRDFTGVRDIVRGYALAATGASAGSTFNLCSGQSRSIRSILDALLNQATREIEIGTDPDRVRPSDNPDVVGDCSRFTEASGWRPVESFDSVLTETLDDWRSRVRRMD